MSDTTLKKMGSLFQVICHIGFKKWIFLKQILNPLKARIKDEHWKLDISADATVDFLPQRRCVFDGTLKT